MLWLCTWRVRCVLNIRSAKSRGERWTSAPGLHCVLTTTRSGGIRLAYKQSRPCVPKHWSVLTRVCLICIATSSSCPRGDFYSNRLAYDEAPLGRRRVWEFFRDMFAQRDDDRLNGLLKAADKTIWSCYHYALLKAGQPKHGPAPLAFMARVALGWLLHAYRPADRCATIDLQTADWLCYASSDCLDVEPQ